MRRGGADEENKKRGGKPGAGRGVGEEKRRKKSGGKNKQSLPRHDTKTNSHFQKNKQPLVQQKA